MLLRTALGCLPCDNDGVPSAHVGRPTQLARLSVTFVISVAVGVIFGQPLGRAPFVPVCLYCFLGLGCALVEVQRRSGRLKPVIAIWSVAILLLVLKAINFVAFIGLVVVGILAGLASDTDEGN